MVETIFSNGEPIGLVRRDSNTGQVAFSPNDGQSRLPEQEWASIDELKAAALKAYQEPQHG